MGRPARPLHDPGNHRPVERGFVRQAACSSLTELAKPAGDQKQPGALTPPPGARSKERALLNNNAVISLRQCVLFFGGQQHNTSIFWPELSSGGVRQYPISGP